MIINGYPHLVDKESLDFWLSIDLPSNGKSKKKK
jgi:hypothetical protein